MITQIDWFISSIKESTYLDHALRLAFTIILIFGAKWLYKLFFNPLIYYWDDPIMNCMSQGERKKREMKAQKRLGTLPPFPNGWYRIICSNELRPGDVKYISALGKEWVVFRTQSGKPGLLGTYCPHMGADLSMGKIEGENIVCPFHAFNFDTSGKCSKIPYQDNIPNAIRCQDVLPIVEINDAIHVWFDVDGNPPHWQVPEIFEGQKDKYKYVARTSHKIYTHIQEIHENGADVAHLPVVHWRTMLQIPIFWHQWGIQWQPCPKVKYMSNFTVFECMKIGNTTIPGTTVHVEGHHIGPGLVHFRLQTILGEVIVAFQLLPLEGFLIDAGYQTWVKKNIPTWFGKILMRGWVQQLEKDAVIWNQKIYLPAAQIVKNDGPIVLYRRWFKQFYSEKGTKKKFDLTDQDLF